jgi:hypothetical protein
MIVVSVFRLRFLLIKTKVCLLLGIRNLRQFCLSIFYAIWVRILQDLRYLALQFFCLLAHNDEGYFRAL